MNYLIVAAHPDDEVLGTGATIKKLSGNNKISVCIMSSDARARAFRPEDSELYADMTVATEFLGVSKRYEGVFPNIEMNTVPHLELVKFIESAIADSQPDVVITHHPADSNNDHLHTSLACQAAFRLFQRRSEIKATLELWYMEVPSATDWSVNTAMNRFTPNVFVEIGEAGVEAKIKALEMYRGVMRDFPHPRSAEAIRGLAAFRGAASGCTYAEAFECALRRIL